MGTLTTDMPASAAGSKRSATDNLESEAIGLDVSVRIHGSQVAAVVLDTTEHVEPFEEDTSTMIVFPRGGVVKLRARVRTGHAVVLTHLGTKQTALCRIVQVNSAANVAHYVKLEFIQPAPGFWGVHFPSDGNTPTAGQAEQVPDAKEIEKPEAAVTPAKSTSAAPVSTVPRVEAPPAPKPIVREAAAKEAAKPVPAAPVSYATFEDVRTDELVPLAAAPPKRTPVAPAAKTHLTPIPPPPAQTPRAADRSAEPPIFDSLSTGEEVFGNEPAGASTEETAILKSNQKAAQAFVRSLDPASLLQGSEAAPRRTGLKVFLSIAAVLLVAAGAAYYVRQYRGSTRQALSAATPVSAPQAPAATVVSAAQAQNVVEAPTVHAPEIQSSPTKAAPVPKHELLETAAENIVTVTPRRNSAKSSASESHVTISNGIANIYAGDLAARPSVAQHSNVAASAPLPSINGDPKDVIAAPANGGLGSLVGSASAALPAPPKPAEPVIRGGQVVEPRLIARVSPSYPSLAASNHIEGDVVVEATIDQTGKVTSTKIISGPTLLRGAAMNAVRQWKYSPATLDGKPVAMQYKVTVRFRLGQ